MIRRPCRPHATPVEYVFLISVITCRMLLCGFLDYYCPQFGERLQLCFTLLTSAALVADIQRGATFVVRYALLARVKLQQREYRSCVFAVYIGTLVLQQVDVLPREHQIPIGSLSNGDRCRPMSLDLANLQQLLIQGK